MAKGNFSAKPKGSKSPYFKGYGEIPMDFFSIIKRSCAGGGKSNRKTKEFNITIEYIWELFVKQERKCALSGVELSMECTGKACKLAETNTRTASLDRIDSSKGYVEGNVQWIHKEINIMKNNTLQSRFIDWCKLIAKHDENRYKQS